MRPETVRQLEDWLLGYRISQVVFTALRLGILSALEASARSADEIARAIGGHRLATAALLRALGGLGVVRRLEGGSYELAALGRTLLDEERGGLVSPLASFTELYQSWSFLGDMIRTGTPAFVLASGGTYWEYCESHPDVGARAMRLVGVTMQEKVNAILEACDFSRFRRIVDVGGAGGALLKAILERYPSIQGVLFDRPGVIAEVRASDGWFRQQPRCELVAGSFFDRVPAGGDAYLLARVLHDWDDQAASAILGCCREAMAPGATLFVVEKTPDAGDESLDRALADLKMMVLFGGRERTEAEYEALLARAGFELAGARATGAGLSIIEAAA
jgi:DNA-binding transcriptional ArsR family regulator